MQNISINMVTPIQNSDMQKSNEPKNIEKKDINFDGAMNEENLEEVDEVFEIELDVENIEEIDDLTKEEKNEDDSELVDDDKKDDAENEKNTEQNDGKGETHQESQKEVLIEGQKTNDLDESREYILNPLNATQNDTNGLKIQTNNNLIDTGIKGQENDKNIADAKTEEPKNLMKEMKELKELSTLREISNILSKMPKEEMMKEKIDFQKIELNVKREFGNVVKIEMNSENESGSDEQQEGDLEFVATNKNTNTNKTKVESNLLKEKLVAELGELTASKVDTKVKSKEVELKVDTEQFGKLKINAKVIGGELKVEIITDKKIDNQMKREIFEMMNDTSKEIDTNIDVEIKDEESEEEKKQQNLEKEKKKRRNSTKDGEFEEVMKGDEKDGSGFDK